MLAILPVMAMAVAATTANPNDMKLLVQDAHVQAGAAGESVGVSMLLRNPTSTTLVISGAYTPMASDTTLQKYVKDEHGLIQTAPVNALSLAPQSETIIAPGALELQLIGLTQNLDAGLEMPLTLKFADGTARVVRIKVDGN